MPDLPPFAALRAFEAVVRLGSVTRAAEELARTHGAVSKQIRSLQEHLGASLFDKAGTGLSPNAQGRALAATVAGAMADLSAGYAAVAAEIRAPALTIACSVTFATRWLAPRLAAYSRAHPQVKVRLAMTSARELSEEGADLAIAWDWRSWPPRAQARAIRVADVAFGPVCAPDYPLRRGADGSGAAPVRIAHDFTSRAWDTWQDRSAVRFSADAEVSFPHTHLGIEAAVAGMGVALVEQRLIARELADSALIAPFGFTAFPDGLAVIPAPGVEASPQVQGFIDWLRASL